MTKRNLLIFFVVILSLNDSYSQQNLPYDTSKISGNKELNFTNTGKRGIETAAGIVYYVEKDMKILTAYENGKIKWKADVMKNCGEPAVGKPEIRFIRMENDKLYIVFGKHSFAYVHKSDGKVDCLGSD